MPSTFDVEKTLMVSEISVSYGDSAKRFSVTSDEKIVPHTRQVSNDRRFTRTGDAEPAMLDSKSVRRTDTSPSNRVHVASCARVPPTPA